jgi:uncharacterized protein (DUF1778 family)
MPEQKNPAEMTEEELAQFYQARKGDVTLWQQSPLRLRNRRGRGPSTSFAVRLSPEELEELQGAAMSQAVTLSEFIRASSLAAARTGVGENRQVLQALRDEAARIAQTLDKLAKTAS